MQSFGYYGDFNYRRPLQAFGLRNSTRNKIHPKDLSIHGWYQFVLGYPPHLVRQYITKFRLNNGDIIFDPFAGLGTTLVEASKNNIISYGVEANPIACFASTVKLYRNYDLKALEECLAYILSSIELSFRYHDIDEPSLDVFDPSTHFGPVVIKKVNGITADQEKLIPKGFISPRPLLKVLIIRDIIERIQDELLKNFFKLALCAFIVKEAGNMAFGPEIYRTNAKKDIESLRGFQNIAISMINDVRQGQLQAPATIYFGDSRDLSKVLPEELLGRINAVITSPPYPNEKDYTRSTRLESVLLGFIKGKEDLRNIKTGLLRSNSRNVFNGDEDEKQVAQFISITSLAEAIENRRLELKKTSGFEKLYHKIVLHYFGGMYRHLKTLKSFLSAQARLAYVVGDQASYFKILIPTAKLLGEIAEHLGYKIKEVERWRTRLATATRKQLDENVLIIET